MAKIILMCLNYGEFRQYTKVSVKNLVVVLAMIAILGLMWVSWSIEQGTKRNK